MKKLPFAVKKKVGILGGGQLGRMLFPPSLDFDISLHFLDPNKDSPCLQFSKNCMVGDFNDRDAVVEFGKDMDVISVEIEHVNVEGLQELEKMGKKVFPQSNILKMVKDKGLQKQWYSDNDIPTSDFHLVNSKDEIKSDFPYVQKLRTGGYDGKGVEVIMNESDLVNRFDAPSVIEELVEFEMELAVLVARNEDGEVKSFPVVGMDFDHKANLVSYLYSPAKINSETERDARILAEEIIGKLEMVGLLAVELFLTKDGKLIVNEMAPRPHNSGHHTIEGNITSQYEQHLRAINNLPLGETDIKSPAVMVNLLGDEGDTGKVIYKGVEKFLAEPGVHFHIYGKSTTKPYRKMGHVTIVRDEMSEAIKLAKEIKKGVSVCAK